MPFSTGIAWSTWACAPPRKNASVPALAPATPRVMPASTMPILRSASSAPSLRVLGGSLVEQSQDDRPGLRIGDDPLGTEHHGLDLTR